MPYLERPWAVDDSDLIVPRGAWIPERNWTAWRMRDVSLPLRRAWTQEEGPTAEQRREFLELGEHAQAPYLDALGRDIGSVHRDGILYANFLERLKVDPSDSVADDVVDKMQKLGLASASWPFTVGGPPPHESPRVWEKVLDWLLKQLGKVAKFIVNTVDFTMVALAPTGVSALAVGVAWPLSVSFEFPANIFTQPQGAGWAKAKTVLDSLIREFSERAFS